MASMSKDEEEAIIALVVGLILAIVVIFMFSIRL